MNTSKEIELEINFSNYVKNEDFRKNKIWLPKNCIVISDPPYNIKYPYNGYSDNLPPLEYRQLLSDAFRGLPSVIIHYSEQSINILRDVMGCDVTRCVFWSFGNITQRQFRLISFYGCKPDFRKGTQPYINPSDERTQVKIDNGKLEAYINDHWHFNQVRGNAKKKIGNPHPCPIPPELAERIVQTTVQKGQTVVDPFSGSGTIMQACKKHHIPYIGFEVCAEYFDYMLKIGLNENKL